MKEDQEHPAYRAARLIKEMHEKTIEMIDGGHIFHRTLESGVVEDVSQSIREQCLEQVSCCEQIMDRAEHMNPEHTSQAYEALMELTTLVSPTVQHEVEEQELPELGSFDHMNGE